MIRSRPMVAAGGAALALALAVGLGSADGTPALDSRDERILVGPGVKPPPAISTGDWSVGPGRVAYNGPTKGLEGYWFPKGDGSRLGDGFVRARVSGVGPVDVSLMLRATVTKGGAVRNGYGVSLERGRLLLYRWDRGRAKAVTEGVHVVGLAEAKRLELVVWMIGPHLSVHLYDGRTLASLVTHTWSDATHVRGRVGFRAHGRTGTSDTLTLLSTRQAGRKSAGRKSPAGRFRFAEVSRAGFDALPEHAKAEVRVLDPDKDPGSAKVVVQTDAVGLERLKRAGLDAAPLLRAVAWKHLDPERHYKDAPAVERIVRDLNARFPQDTQVVELGRTRQDRPVLALRIGGPGDEPVERRPSVLLNGGHHGKELMSIEFALDAMTYLLEEGRDDPRAARWRKELAVWCVPLVNPDANMAYMNRSTRAGRKNGAGVDLNRNYPFRWGALGERGSRSKPTAAWYRGPRAASEPETQAMMRLADQERFVASISFHTNGTLILTPYTIDGVPNPAPDEARGIAQALAKAAGMQGIGRPYKVKRKMYSVDGVDQDWLRAAHGTVAFLVEGPHHNPVDPEVRKADVAGARPIWMGLLDRVLDGPSVSGRVALTDGAPTSAVVSLSGVRTKAGERWPSRCRDGRFQRLVPDAPGGFAKAPGADKVRAVVDAPVQLTVDPSVSASLPERVCPRPDLCAIDSLCLARQDQCPQAGPPAWCLIEGTCYEAAARGPKACAVCDPQADPWAWSRPADCSAR